MSKNKSINQEAAIIRRRLINQGVKYLYDYKGDKVPLDYVPSLDLLKHVATKELIDKAKALQDQLRAVKAEAQEVGDTLHERMMKENQIQATSVGGFTLATFDGDQKVLYKMRTVEEIDEEQLMLCKEAKQQFINEIDEKMSEEVKAIIPLLNEIFETSSGQIDTRKLRGMNRYREQIKNKWFRKFLDHGNAAVKLRHTKRSETFHEKNDQGELESILLSYSRVELPEREEEAQVETEQEAAPDGV